ncbi:MAG: lycopene cyclase family protein, partial [Chitinophagaceae bacterium]
MLKSQSYHYIICGAGCAGLSLLMRMLESAHFRDKRILLIDKEEKIRNDRTWCFWEKDSGFFEDIVFRKWSSISFLSDSFSRVMDISPYDYKMIRGIDFYNSCFREIEKHKNVEVVYGHLQSWEMDKERLTLTIDEKEYRLINTGTYLFNSIYKPAPQKKKSIRLLQHFKGWVIETKEPVFKTGQATIMDFRVHQDQGMAFAYVLPFNSTSALVEYTLFTKELLLKEQYDVELKNYIQTFLKIDDYEINEKEFGVIPMTNETVDFGADGWQIGTAGGQTKASSGYTFQFIQKQSQQIVEYLISEKSLLAMPRTAKRFGFYDHTLLDILYN